MAKQPPLGGYQVDEIPFEEIDYDPNPRTFTTDAQGNTRVGANQPLGRGQSGLPAGANAADDSLVRIRANAPTRTTTAPMRGLPPEPMPEGVGNALAKSERVLGNNLGARVAPRAMGGVVGSAIGGIPAAANAYDVYSGTDGDLSATARQIGFDAAPLVGGAIGGALGATAGGVAGAPSGPGAIATGLAGATALGTAGYSAGDGAVRSFDRALGGTGQSPLEEMQARAATQGPRENVSVSAAAPDVPVPVGQAGSVSIDPITGLTADGAAPAQPSAITQEQVQAGRQVLAEAEAARRAEARASGGGGGTGQPRNVRGTQSNADSMALGAAPATEVTGYRRPDGGVDVVRRTDVNGVPTFTNIGITDAERAQVQNQGVRPLGNTLPAPGTPGSGVPSMAEFRARDAADAAAARARTAQQRAEINEGAIQGLLAQNDPNARRMAAALAQENARLGGVRDTSQSTADQFAAQGVNNEAALQIARERNALGQRGLQTAVQLERLRQSTQKTANADDDAEAKTNADYFDRALPAQFGQQDADGNTVVPQETQAFISQYQPNWVQQQEADYGQQLSALRARAANDPQAQRQLQAVTQDYQNFRRGVYRLNTDGSVAGLRPVREMNPVLQQRFFNAANTVQRGQQRQTGFGRPELGAALGGALGAGLARTPGGRVARGAARVLGGVAGAGGGYALGTAATETPNVVTQGPNALDPTMDSNIDSVQTQNGETIVRTRDGNAYNLTNLRYQQNQPGAVLGRSAGQASRTTNQYAPVANAAARRVLAQVQSVDRDITRRQARDLVDFPGLDADLRKRLQQLADQEQ